MPPPQTNPPPQTSPPAPGPAYPPSHPVIGAPRALGQVVTSQPEGSHVILSKNVVSVLHPSPGAFCIVLTPEILAYEAVMVATLRLPLIYLPRYSISHIETKSDCALSERRAGRDGEPVGAASSRADRHARRPGTSCPRSISNASSSPLAARSPTGLIGPTSIGKRPASRPHPQGREAGRHAGAGADKVRNSHQPQDRQSARPHRAASLLAAPTR